MNLRDLKYFIAVADAGHFGRAAARCNVSQPTLSGQIKKLEGELGVDLFERTNRKVIVTDAGMKIRSLAQRVVESASEIEMLAASLRNPLTGTFRLGAIPTVSPFIFPKLVSGVRARLPDIRLVLHEDITSELIDKLEKGRVDAIIAALPLEGDLLRSRHVFDDPFLLSVPPEHHLAFATEVDRAELSGLNPLLLSEGHCLRDQALEICGVASDEDEPDLRATSIETLRQMVKAGSGVTLMPQIAIKPNEPGISYVPISPSPKRSIGLLWRKTTSRSAVNEIIADLTIEVARAHRPFEE